EDVLFSGGHHRSSHASPSRLPVALQRSISAANHEIFLELARRAQTSRWPAPVAEVFAVVWHDDSSAVQLSHVFGKTVSIARAAIWPASVTRRGTVNKLAQLRR